MERELMGRQEVPPPVAIEVPYLVSQRVRSGDITDTRTCHLYLGARLRPSAWDRKQA